MTTREQLIDELSSISSSAGLMKNIIRDSGYTSDSMENNLAKLTEKLQVKSDRITEMLNCGILDNPKLRNPEVAKILEDLVKQVGLSVKELTDLGIEKAVEVAIKWIVKKLR